MTTKKVMLNYSVEKANVPIIASVIRDEDVLINILHADLTERGGQILIDIDAPEAKAQKVMKIFEERGVEVEEIRSVITLDQDTCLDCGACISICPTRALTLAEDFSLELEEDKCVICDACIPVCPVRALGIREL